MSDRRSEQPSGDEPPSSSFIADEVWEQFIRDTERDIRKSAPKEPSARARQVTERLKGQKEPEGWRTGPAWQEMDGRAVRRRRIWAAVGLPLAIAVAVVAMRPSLIPGDPFGSSSGSSSGTDTATPPLPAETAAPTAPRSAVAADTPTLAHPFAGSPALRWADGAAGIVLPKATALGSIPKDRAELALQQTKKLLVAANLDPDVVAGAHPDAALALLDPQQPRLLDDLNTAPRTPSGTHDPLSLFSRFDPEDVHLAGQVIKTRGRITFAKGKFEGVAVHADFTFVYPVVRADGSTEVTRTIVRRVIDTELPDPTRYRVTPGRLTLLSYDEDAGNSACDIKRLSAPAVPVAGAHGQRRPDGPVDRPVRPQP